jgi:purine-binding chemotaxis protein CheW
MDSFRIGTKSREAAAHDTPAADARSDPAEALEVPDPAPAAAGADGTAALGGELAARLQDLPAPAEGRFTTWRPGAGAPPRAAAPPPAQRAPEPDTFQVASALGGALSAIPAASSGGPEAPHGKAADPLDEFFYREDEEAPEVPALGVALAQPGADEQGSTILEEYLTFVLGEEEYAVAIERVREVMRAPPITEVPHAPPDVLGVVTVRGEVVAVFDPRRRLRLPGSAPIAGGGRVVIVDAGEGPCGLLVDAVANVVRLRPGSIEPCPQGIGGASADCLAGIGRQGERLFTVLDLGAFLRRPVAGSRRRGGDRHAGA